jgi:hypothetical protein
MGKGYWEFIISDETEPPLPKNPTQQQIQANKTWHDTTRNLSFCNCRMQLVFSCMRHMQLQIRLVA